jgi:hypothetical protein
VINPTSVGSAVVFVVGPATPRLASATVRVSVVVVLSLIVAASLAEPPATGHQVGPACGHRAAAERDVRDGDLAVDGLVDDRDDVGQRPELRLAVGRHEREADAVRAVVAESGRRRRQQGDGRRGRCRLARRRAEQQLALGFSDGDGFGCRGR